MGDIIKLLGMSVNCVDKEKNFSPSHSMKYHRMLVTFIKELMDIMIGDISGFKSLSWREIP